MKLLFGAIGVLILCSLSHTAPVPKEKAKEPSTPDISGECQFGMVKQTGRKIVISGHANWYAEGEIRKDGKTLGILWTTANGDRALAVYAINGQELSGHWQWEAYSEIDEKGNLVAKEGYGLSYELLRERKE